MIFTKEKEYPINLIQWLVPADQPRVELYAEIQSEIEENESNTLVIHAHEDDKTYAVLVVHNFLDCVFISQFRCRPHFTHKNEMWGMLIEWANSKHKNKIETKPYNTRLEGYFKRRFGFESQGDRLVYEFKR
jgi:hypothetical protein